MTVHAGLAWLAAGLGALASTTATLVWMNHGRTAERARAAKLDRFCLATRVALDEDRRAFESGDDAMREAAYERFYEGQALYHSAPSLLYCVDTLPEMPLHCRLQRDWGCLARLAREIESTLP